MTKVFVELTILQASLYVEVFFFFIGLGGHKPTIIDVVENRLQRLVHKEVRVIP